MDGRDVERGNIRVRIGRGGRRKVNKGIMDIKRDRRRAERGCMSSVCNNLLSVRMGKIREDERREGKAVTCLHDVVDITGGC